MTKSFFVLGILGIAVSGCAPDAPLQPSAQGPTPLQPSALQMSTTYEAIDLGLTTPFSTVGAIEKDGSVYALARGEDFLAHVFYWKDGALADLGALPTATSVVRFAPGGVVAGHFNSCAPDGCHGPANFFVWEDGITTPLDAGGTVSSDESRVRAVESADLILAFLQRSGGSLGVLWRRGERIDLPHLSADYPFTNPTHMNKRGQVIAQSLPASSNHSRVSLWEDGVIRDLGVLADRPCFDDPSQNCGSAFPGDLNDAGDVVGSSDDASGQSRAVVWSKGGAIEELGVFPGQFTMARLINDQGQIVGLGGPTRWFFWDRGALQLIGTLGGSFTQVHALSERGHVMGTGTTADGRVHAFIWKNGQMVDLAPPGAGNSEAFAVNDRGEVLGVWLTETGERRVMLWRPASLSATASR